MKFSEIAVQFACEGEQLAGIVSLPETSSGYGVVVIVGGPQYRIGSHRQFVLLARELASNGVTVIRFDYRGMGDSSGPLRDFNDIDSDLRAAIDALQKTDTRIKRVVLWGLCDAASAALFYANKDHRVAGLAIANPWVRTDAGEAKAYLSHYYRARVFDPALWKKVIRGQFDFFGSIQSFWTVAKKAITKPVLKGQEIQLPLRERMYESWRSFKGPILLILSGEDLTAKEFTDMVSTSPQWRALIDTSRVATHSLPTANHTFSRKEWRDDVATKTSNWVKALSNTEAPAK